MLVLMPAATPLIRPEAMIASSDGLERILTISRNVSPTDSFRSGARLRVGMYRWVAIDEIMIARKSTIAAVIPKWA